MILPKQKILQLINSDTPLIEGFIDLKTQLQPASFDLTLKKVFKLKDGGRLDFTNEERYIPKKDEVEFKGEWVELEKGCYIVMYNEIVRIPLNLMMIVRPRSSLLRMGASLHASLWDPGYYGRSVSLLIVHSENGIKLKRNARIAQAVFLQLSEETTDSYQGIYKGENV